MMYLHPFPYTIAARLNFQTPSLKVINYLGMIGIDNPGWAPSGQMILMHFNREPKNEPHLVFA